MMTARSALYSTKPDLNYFAMLLCKISMSSGDAKIPTRLLPASQRVLITHIYTCELGRKSKNIKTEPE